jgi:hypothetical protein
VHSTRGGTQRLLRELSLGEFMPEVLFLH